MRIADVRKLLETYSKTQLQVIIAEMYKAIPKAVKEDKNIDEILTNPDASTSSKKRRKPVPVPDIESLRDETEQFIDNAYNQYYFAPNSVVSKRNRPKWRFVVKRFYKSLLAVATVEADLPIASDLLEQLYVMLCYSCSYTLFTAYDSFQSVGIEQTTFFQSVLSLKHAHEPLATFVPNAIALIVENSVNRYTLPTTLMHIAMGFFQTPDIQELGIRACDTTITQEKSRTKTARDDWSETITVNLSRDAFIPGI